MITLDSAQAAVLAFDPNRHARILGAPGTGKSTVLTESFAHVLDLPGWNEGEILAISPARASAAQLRASVEQRVARALGGVPVRTPASLAFAVLAQASAHHGDTAPRLLTGTAQDELIGVAVEGLLEPGGAWGDDLAGPGMRGTGRLSSLAEDVLRTPVFRAELREFWRVLDDFDCEVETTLRELAKLRGSAAGEAHTLAPADALIELWSDALVVIDRAESLRSAQRPDELSASALLRAAARELRSGTVRPPRLLLVDDAQELGEGQLALLAACAAAGSSVWVFGDPDMATASFHGERTEVLTQLAAEFARRGVPAATEQTGVLDVVYRHGAVLRSLVAGLTARIGAAGAGEQRAAVSADRADTAASGAAAVRFVRADSPAEQLGMIAHRMRSRHLGLEEADGASDSAVAAADGAENVAERRNTLHDGGGSEWRSMAVICRSRAEAARIARGLALHQVPVAVASGGIVLREHRIVRDLIRLLQHAWGIRTIDAADVLELLSGTIGGLDPVAVRRLRGALMMQERREARDDEREARDIDALLLDAFMFPGAEAVVDSAGGRALRRLGLIGAAGSSVREAEGTARETLWALWDGTRLAAGWQDEALSGRGVRADEANRSLDAVLGLFFALQRHEEQDSDQPIAVLLEELLESAVPEDTLARQAARDAIVVTTPQGAVGREFDFVAVTGPQDGSWPNLRSRGSILGTVAFERWLRGGAAAAASRSDTMHDELRLFAQTVSRAREELLVVAITDDEQHPSPFFNFGSSHFASRLPSSRLTLRGATAQLRRRLTEQPDDHAALVSLAALARADVPGAHPDDWYGVRPPSTDAPLYDLSDGAPLVPVSPSRLEAAEQCPLNWAVSTLGGGSGSVQASIGTLVHHALETARSHDPAEIFAAIMREWRKLPFDAAWESERAQRTAEAMADGLAAYLREFDASDRELIGRETGFKIEIGRAVLRGMADRLEQRVTPHGVEVTVLDLKTGRTPPSKAEAEQHVQLQAYQLGVTRGAFEFAEETPVSGEIAGALAEEPGDGTHEQTPSMRSGGARLLYVHPDATGKSAFIERTQQTLSEEAGIELAQRVEQIAAVMAAGSFTARVEHHCSDPHQPGDCRLHIIQAVSHA